MLSTLSSVKSRLAIPDLNVEFDDLLTTALTALSARFDRETNRTLTRTANTTHEFDPCETEIIPPSYPIESVSKFETKSTEAEGWIEQTGIDYLIRNSTAVTHSSPLAFDARPSALGRLTYTGGYVLPGDTPGTGQTPLPPDLEQAAVEKVAYWFQNRDKLGLLRYWPHDGIYQQLSGLDLLPSVAAVLVKYKRWSI
jgi:hypothetical protein